MAGFTPFKRNANKFNYTPRYYDPAKEAREQRRAELRGQRSDDSTDEEYTPGQFIRNKRMARQEGKRSESRRSKRGNLLFTVALIAILFLIGSALYPKLIAAFGLTERTPTPTQQAIEEAEFNPHIPITIVPNDYQEE